MGYAATRMVHINWSPAVATTSETTAVFSVRPGDRILWCSAMPMISASVGAVGTVSLGDGNGVASLIGVFTPTQAASPLGTLIGGAGAYLANSGGKLYTVADTIDVDFIYTSGGVIKPVIKFHIAVTRESN
jgi:hypothetical protein